MPVAGIDGNFKPTLIALSSANNGQIVDLWADPVTHRLLVDSAGGGTGTVTSVSVVTANGFAGTVATATTTPAITLTTTITGLLKGNGTAISAASDGTDYLSPTTGITVSQSTPQTLGVTGSRLLKLWATDITVTNAITGSITGNAATVTTNANLTGDVTSSGNATTLATVNSNVGSFTNANITVNAKGLITAASNGSGGSGITIGTTTIASGTSTRILYDNGGVVGEYTLTGTGTVAVMQNTPTLTTPVLGVATATSINGLTITSSTGTLTIANGKTHTVNNSITLAGTDSTTMTFPSTSATIARTDAAQTFTGAQTYTNQVNYTNNAIAAVSNAATVPITARLSTVTNNSAATCTITITTTSAVDGQLLIVRYYDSSAVAQTLTWVNTENSGASVITTSNGSTTLPVTSGFQFNSQTTKWRCLFSV